MNLSLISWNDIIYLVYLVITAKVFHVMGYSNCFTDVCDSHGYDGDDLVEILDDYDKEKKE